MKIQIFVRRDRNAVCYGRSYDGEEFAAEIQHLYLPGTPVYESETEEVDRPFIDPSSPGRHQTYARDGRGRVIEAILKKHVRPLQST